MDTKVLAGPPPRRSSVFRHGNELRQLISARPWRVSGYGNDKNNDCLGAAARGTVPRVPTVPMVPMVFAVVAHHHG
jgi:hypothetical protein